MNFLASVEISFKDNTTKTFNCTIRDAYNKEFALFKLQKAIENAYPTKQSYKVIYCYPEHNNNSMPDFMKDFFGGM